MARPYHMYRLSDCTERVYRSSEPVLVIPCSSQCQVGTDSCAYRSQLELLADLPLSIIMVQERDLPQILMLLGGASWGHALLFCHGQLIQHWLQIPTRAELDARLTSLAAS